MARAALEWSTGELARAAKVGISTVSRFETSQAVPIKASLAAMQSALEAAGVVFLAAGEMVDGGPGVRLAEAGNGTR